MRWYWLALITLSILTFVGPAQNVSAQEFTSLDGRVLNGTPASPPLPQIPITLELSRDGVQISQSHTTSGITGEFQFTEVPIDSTFLQVLRWEYLGVKYTRVLSPSLPENPISLLVYETTPSIDAISVLESAVVFTHAESSSSWLFALELHRIRNSGDHTLLPDIDQGNAMDMLRFPLPPGATDLDVRLQLEGGNLTQVDKGFAITTPIPPGHHEILFTYKAPYNGSKLELDYRLPFGARTFDVLLAEDLGTLESPNLEERPVAAFEGKRFQVLEGRDLDRETRVEIVLRGLPQKSLQERIWSGISESPYGLMGIPITLGGMLLISMILILLRHHKQNHPLTTETPNLMEMKREALVDAIARLDQISETGDIEESLYRSKRDALTARLRTITLSPSTPHGSHLSASTPYEEGQDEQISKEE